MDIKEALKKRKEFEAGIIAKALENPDFRKELLENPKAVVEREAGKKLPDEVKIKIIEEEPATVIIAVPSMPDTLKNNDEISAELLDKISGGLESGVDSVYQKGMVCL